MRIAALFLLAFPPINAAFWLINFSRPASRHGG